MKLSTKIFLLAAMTFIIVSSMEGMAKEIRIGFSGPLSGPAAEYGQDCVNGIDMAIKEINSAGGITVKGVKYTFKLERLDDRMDPTMAVNNARRLSAEKTVAIFSPVFNTLAAMMKINQEKGNAFLLMAYVSVPELSKMGNDLLIRITLPNTVYINSFVEKAWQMGWRKLGMLVTLGGYGDAWRSGFKAAWKKRGGKITEDKPANYYKDTDFSTQITAVLQTKPDAILIGGPSTSTALVIEQARNMGFKGGFILIDQAKIDYIALILRGKKLINNVIGVGAVAEVPGPNTRPFTKRYESAYKRMLTWEAALNYGGMINLSRAIVAAGTVDDVKAIRVAFPKILPMLGKGIVDFFGMNEEGDMYIGASVQMVKNGQYTKAVSYDWFSKNLKDHNKVKKQSTGYSPFLWLK